MNIAISEKINKAVKKDIIDLENKINLFKDGLIPEDKFKHFRLTRGVYGQRQTGVQMIRIKLPFGKITTNQLVKIADVADEYSTGNLHITTRQNIQLHFVKLRNTAVLWSKLEEEGITLRESCGNTVRNITASPKAGIDPGEPFDVSPYANALFTYFLRNPICQDMGRKIKIAFSSSEKDSAFAYFHDFGFIPRVIINKDKEETGFKVVIGGGLGAQPFIAVTAYEFLLQDQLIPFVEASLRVFDRYGERAKRHKARLKYLIQLLGLEEFLNLVRSERKALKNKSFRIIIPPDEVPFLNSLPEKDEKINNQNKYEKWLHTNVFLQKQKNYYGVQIRVKLGNLPSEKARQLAAIVKTYAANDIRLTQNQGIIVKYVRFEFLKTLFNALDALGLAEPGFDSVHDITACPGSDTCNLAVTNSTGLAHALEVVLKEEFEDLIYESGIHIKISGCMNSCGQHMAANIGFHGSSIKNGNLIIPAMQVVLGGGVDDDGNGNIAEKIIKIPTKKTPDVIRVVLKDYEENALEEEYFNDYFRRQGKNYFYHLLKPLSDLSSLNKEDYQDWGTNSNFRTQIGVGECAGITLDVVSTIIKEAEEKIHNASEALEEDSFADSIYNSYSAFVISAKALLLSIDKQCNSQIGIIRSFKEFLINPGKIRWHGSFEESVLQINKHEPEKWFAEKYLNEARLFIKQVNEYRQKQTDSDLEEKNKVVIENYYKA